jgi:hypothetical protein
MVAVTVACPASAQTRDELEQQVVQLRIVKGDAGESECGVGVLVTPRLILTAAHVIEGARQVAVSTRRSGREVSYDIPGLQASVHTADTGANHDVGVLELQTDWVGAAPEYRTPLTRVPADRVQRATRLRFYTFHNQDPAASCKGSQQGSAQGLHATEVNVVTAGYVERDGAESIRLTPSLDRAYSGSPLVMAPCGKRPWCVIGVLSKRSNDAGEQAALAAGLDSATVGDFLHGSMGLSVEDYVDARAAPVGALISAGPIFNEYVGHGVRGFAWGFEERFSWLTGFGRDNAWALAVGLALSQEFFAGGTFDSVIQSPDGGWTTLAGTEEVGTAFRAEPFAGVEFLRSEPVSLRVLVGPHWAIYPTGHGGAPTSNGWSALLGGRVRPTERFFIDFAAVGRFLSFSLDGKRYTLVPGQLEDVEHTVRGWSVGIQTAAGYAIP